jgi:superoxide dismutase
MHNSPHSLTHRATHAHGVVCVQGSGWGWLGYNKGSKALEIVTCANQDPLAAKVRRARGRELCKHSSVLCLHTRS